MSWMCIDFANRRAKRSDTREVSAPWFPVLLAWPFLLIYLAACRPAVDEPTPDKIAGNPAVVVQVEPRVEVVGLTEFGDVSLRGIAQNGPNTVWVSGTQGTVRRSLDGGATWENVAPPGTEELDFRDVAILDAETVLLMSVGPGSSSRVYKTTDGGSSWVKTLENDLEGAFYNGFDFSTSREGVLTSDSTDGRLLLLKTEDGGDHWARIGAETLPPLVEGEAGFAASGTGVVAADQDLWVATGGSEARVFRSRDQGVSWEVFETPMVHGNPSTGIFSIAFRDTQVGVVVGGDYLDPSQDPGNVAWTENGGETWTRSTSSVPIEQKSCVQFLSEKIVLGAGRSGLVLSRDQGRSWAALEGPAYYTFGFDRGSGVGFLAGSDGRVGRFQLAL